MHDVTVRPLPNKLDLHLEMTEPAEISHLYSGGDVEAQRREASTCLSIGIRARADASTTLNLNLINEQFHEFQRNFEHNATAIAQRVMLGPIQDLFSLDKPDSILQRFAKQISDGNKQGKDGLEQAMTSLKCDLAPDNPQSPIAKACEFWTSGVRSITSELSLDNPTSGLSRVHKAVTDPLEKMAAVMAAMAARLDADSRSPAKGNTFEDQVGELVGSFAAARGDLFEDVTAIAGRNGKAKKGDFVITLGATHAAGGARIPIEGKNQAGYSTTRMAKELKGACENRNGNFGLFVMSIDTAPAGCAPSRNATTAHWFCGIPTTAPPIRWSKWVSICVPPWQYGSRSRRKVASLISAASTTVWPTSSATLRHSTRSRPRRHRPRRRSGRSST
jgi:hypothetical protein